MVKHKVLPDKRRSVVRRSFSLWAPGLWNDDYGGKGEELGKEPNYAVTQLANNCNEIH